MSDTPAASTGIIGGGTSSAALPAPAGVAPPKRKRGRKGSAKALLFLLPALLILGGLVVYPIVATVIRSLFDRGGDTFVGLDNYTGLFENQGTRTALKNNLIWVIFAPTITTALGLVFAVLAERVRWQTAFKLAVFMPMAISFLAAGVIFRLVYETNPDRGVLNAALTTISGKFNPGGEYEGARETSPGLFKSDVDRTTVATFTPGSTANIGLVALPPDRVPDNAKPAPIVTPAVDDPDAIRGVVWLDFAPGGGGVKGLIDNAEKGLPGIPVSAIDSSGQVVATDTTNQAGEFKIDGLSGGPFNLRLEPQAFNAPYTGVNWLGEQLVTASVIAAFVWIWAGFAMIVIGAGLAAIPREVLEAARVDGANEWQVFRRVTVPLLAPVLTVVLVTLVINVLKVFDLVFIIPPGDVQDDATVIALQMWQVSFGNSPDQGLGSAISVVLLLLVLPAMIINIKRFRSAN